MFYFSLALLAILIIYILIVLIIIENKNLEIKRTQKELIYLLDSQISLIQPLSKVFTVYFPSEKPVVKNAVNISKEYKTYDDLESKFMCVKQINYIFAHLFPLIKKYNLVDNNEKYLLNKEKFIFNEEKINVNKQLEENLIERYNVFISFFPNNLIASFLNIEKI